MKAMFWLRVLAWIKRGVIALESIAASQRAVAATVVPQPRKKIKLAEIHTPSIDDMGAEWQRRQDEKVYGEELPR